MVVVVLVVRLAHGGLRPSPLTAPDGAGHCQVLAPPPAPGLARAAPALPESSSPTSPQSHHTSFRRGSSAGPLSARRFQAQDAGRPRRAALCSLTRRRGPTCPSDVMDGTLPFTGSAGSWPSAFWCISGTWNSSFPPLDRGVRAEPGTDRGVDDGSASFCGSSSSIRTSKTTPALT